jgi:4-amino-4-deoxy-L-arabinose transferase-like glycosyltransferase
MQGQGSKVIDKTPGSSLIYFILAGLLAVLVVSIIILSSVPPVCRDSLTHHLAVPKLYLKHGGMFQIPSVIFSYYPMNVDLLYIIPLYFGNDIVPKYIHFLFALLTAFLVYGYLKKRTDRIFALFGALFFLTIPVIVKLSITVYVDLGLIFFSTASIIFLFKWIEDEFKLRHLVVSAVFCGLALGTKYNALIVFFLLTMFVMYASSRVSGAEESGGSKLKTGKNNSMKALFFGVLYIVAVLLVFSPWMIRNYIWTKNPVYPLYQGVFSRLNTGPVIPAQIQSQVLDEGDNSIIKPIKDNKGREVSHFAVRRIIYNESLIQTVLVPVRIFFQGEDNNPKYFDGKLSPFLFILPFFAFFRIKRDSPSLKMEKAILLSFSILFILFAFAKTDMRIRYIAPVIPPLVILSAMGLYNIYLLLKDKVSDSSGKISLLFLSVLFAAIISVNGIYIFQQFRLVNPVEYITGGIGRDEYIERYRPEYAAVKFANSNLPKDAKILCLFLGNRSYYSDREMLFDYSIIMRSIKNGNMISSDLKKKGITHILIWYDMFNSWANINFNEDEKVLLSRFFEENTNLLFSKGGHGLYELKHDR